MPQCASLRCPPSCFSPLACMILLSLPNVIRQQVRVQTSLVTKPRVQVPPPDDRAERSEAAEARARALQRAPREACPFTAIDTFYSRPAGSLGPKSQAGARNKRTVAVHTGTPAGPKKKRNTEGEEKNPEHRGGPERQRNTQGYTEHQGDLFLNGTPRGQNGTPRGV